MATITHRIGGIDYQETGGLGCQLKSVERHIPVGTVRVIKDHLMYVTSVNRLAWYSNKFRIGWCLVFEPYGKLSTDTDSIKKFINYIREY